MKKLILWLAVFFGITAHALAAPLNTTILTSMPNCSGGDIEDTENIVRYVGENFNPIATFSQGNTVDWIFGTVSSGVEIYDPHNILAGQTFQIQSNVKPQGVDTVLFAALENEIQALDVPVPRGVSVATLRFRITRMHNNGNYVNGAFNGEYRPFTSINIPSLPTLNQTYDISSFDTSTLVTDKFECWTIAINKCGDLVRDTGFEECDGGANCITVGSDQCTCPSGFQPDGSNGCTFVGSVCGNNIVETGEQCDDGNTVNGDGCSATCQTENGAPFCTGTNGQIINAIGDAITTCSDGSTASSSVINVGGTDVVRWTCGANSCESTVNNSAIACSGSNGTTIANAGSAVTTCTNGGTATNINTTADEVTWTCDVQSCTALINNPPVFCAGSNGTTVATAGDVVAACTSGVATNVDISGSPATWNCGVLSCSAQVNAGAACGNGVVEGTEQCDDGNTNSGDGCSAICETESGAPFCAGTNGQTVNTESQVIAECSDGTTQTPTEDLTGVNIVFRWSCGANPCETTIDSTAVVCAGTNGQNVATAGDVVSACTNGGTPSGVNDDGTRVTWTCAAEACSTDYGSIDSPFCAGTNGTTVATAGDVVSACTHGATATNVDTSGNPVTWICGFRSCSTQLQATGPSIDIDVIDNDGGLSDDTQTINSGDTANFTIRVRNNGNENLTGITVTSNPLATSCNTAIASLTVGTFQSYNCSLANILASYTQEATATGTASGGSTQTDTDGTNVVVASGTCGNNIVESGEACEPWINGADPNNPTSCTNTCQLRQPACGSSNNITDGCTAGTYTFVDANNWTCFLNGTTENCDDTGGGTNPSCFPYVGTFSSQPATDTASGCNDGIYTDIADTVTEFRWQCSIAGFPVTCSVDRGSVIGGGCGNGIVEGTEQCDDGNTVAGDGCNSCVLENLCGTNNNPTDGCILGVYNRINSGTWTCSANGFVNTCGNNGGGCTNPNGCLPTCITGPGTCVTGNPFTSINTFNVNAKFGAFGNIYNGVWGYEYTTNNGTIVEYDGNSHSSLISVINAGQSNIISALGPVSVSKIVGNDMEIFEEKICVSRSVFVNKDENQRFCLNTATDRPNDDVPFTGTGYGPNETCWNVFDDEGNPQLDTSDPDLYCVTDVNGLLTGSIDSSLVGYTDGLFTLYAYDTTTDLVLDLVVLGVRVGGPTIESITGGNAMIGLPLAHNIRSLVRGVQILDNTGTPISGINQVQSNFVSNLGVIAVEDGNTRKIANLSSVTSEDENLTIIDTNNQEEYTRLSHNLLSNNQSIILSNMSQLGTLNNKQEDKEIYTFGSDLTMDLSQTLTGVRTIIVENGDLVINKNINYADEDASWAFIIKNGNVIVDKDVEEISGVFIALCPENTTNFDACGKIEAKASEETQTHLSVIGSLHGNIEHLVNHRTYLYGAIINSNSSNGVLPGVTVKYSNRVFKNTPPLLDTFFGKYTLQRTAQ